MKKLFLSLAISAISLSGSAQAFSYTPVKVEANGLPSWSADSLTITYPFIVTVGIVGEPYGFLAPNPNKNMFVFSLSAKEARSPESLMKYAWTEADKWVKLKYPDIK